MAMTKEERMLLHWKRIILAATTLDPVPSPAYVTAKTNDSAEKENNQDGQITEDSRQETERAE